ncbi:hypothetical protein B0H34DRAFT_796432 [Crassisporium funariophilum]|nr:hypothetical protein B0H34DRAFT_796432 [Crassisporium funariophilum]
MKLQGFFSAANFISLVLLLSHSTLPVFGGLACFPACAIACCEAASAAVFAGPLGVVAGLTGCAGVCSVACATLVWLPPACFAGDTSISALISLPNTKNGTYIINKPISEVRVGDEVLTLVDGQHRTTRIVRNIHAKGDFDFLEFELVRIHALGIEDGGVASTRNLKVTPRHSMLLVELLSSEMRFAHAEDVKKGDMMKTSDGSTWQVSNILPSTGDERYTLVTAEGSVLASGVLVSTICEEEVSTGQRLEEVEQGWKLKHGYGMYTQQGLAVSVLMGV